MPNPTRARAIARQESGHHRVVALSAAKTLTDDDGGTYHTVDQSASAFDITLPTISATRAGWWADFVIATAGSNDVDVVAASGDEDKIHGLENSDTAVSISAADKVTFASGNAGVGDWLHIWTDGTNWYARQSSVADAGATQSG